MLCSITVGGKFICQKILNDGGVEDDEAKEKKGATYGQKRLGQVVDAKYHLQQLRRKRCPSTRGDDRCGTQSDQVLG